MVNDIYEKGDQKEIRPLRIEHIENSPELIVNVSGIEQPLCFNVGTREETVRVLQDPKTGIIVNAQILHDNLNNKTYIGTVLISQGNICLLGTQYFLLVNNAKFNWGEIRDLSVDGHRILIRDNIVLVTFRQCRITLAVHRHTTGENSMDYSESGRESDNKPEETSKDDDRDSAGPEGRPDIHPLIGYEQSESFINHFLSSKRRRALLLQKYFGINQDSAVVRNVLIEVDSEGRKKRGNVKDDSEQALHDGSVADKAEREENQHGQGNMPDVQSLNDEGGDGLKGFKPLGDYDEVQQDESNDGGRVEREAEKRRDSNIVLDIYVVDSRDFSNKTHGLLGQFLFKNVTREKIRYKDGKATARLLLQENPVLRTNALFTSRYYDAINGTRKCWKLRQNGREVIDGNYSDYTVPSISYRNLKELPPPGPL